MVHRRNRIVSKVKSRYWKTTHKFGIRLPKSVKEALEIDRMTNTDFWRKAINKEMAKVKVAWALMTDVCHSKLEKVMYPTSPDSRKLDVTLFSISRWISLARHGLWPVDIQQRHRVL
jgi:hypothetical protein